MFSGTQRKTSNSYQKMKYQNRTKIGTNKKEHSEI